MVVQIGAGPGAGPVCGAKRIRSLYLPSMTPVTPRLSTAAPPKGLTSLSVINAAITPWRDAFADLSASGGADLPASAHLSRLEAAPMGAGVDGNIRGRRRWLVYNAG
jgi:hypothetical protein